MIPEGGALPPEEAFIVTLNDYYLKSAASDFPGALTDFKNALSINKSISDKHLRGRHYYQLLLVAILDIENKPVHQLGNIDKVEDPDALASYAPDKTLLRQPDSFEWLMAQAVRSRSLLNTADVPIGRALSIYESSANRLQKLSPSDNPTIIAQRCERMQALLSFQQALAELLASTLVDPGDVQSAPFGDKIAVVKHAMQIFDSRSVDFILSYADNSAAKQLGEGNWKSAEAGYSMIIGLLNDSDPKPPRADYRYIKIQLQRANIALVSGQLGGTSLLLQSSFDKLASVADPHDRDELTGIFYNYEGQYKGRIGDNEGAEEDYRKAIAAFDSINDPDLIGTFALLADNLTLCGRYEEANTTIKEALAKTDTLESKTGTRYTHQRQKLSLAQVINSFHSNDPAYAGIVAEALKSIPDGRYRAVALYYKGLFEENAKQLQDALGSFREAIAFYNDDDQSPILFETSYHFGKCLLEAREYNAAADVLDRALRIHNNLREFARGTDAYDVTYAETDLDQVTALLASAIVHASPNQEMLSREAAIKLLYYTEMSKSRALIDEMESTRRGAIWFTTVAPSHSDAHAAATDTEDLFRPESTVEKVRENGEKYLDVVQAFAATLSKRHGQPAIILEYVPVVKDDALFLYAVTSEQVRWCRLSRRWSDVLAEAQKQALLIKKSLDAYTQLRLSPSPDESLVTEVQQIEVRLKESCQALGNDLLPATLHVGDQSLPQAVAGRSLIIVPYGALHNLPFSCLRTSPGGSVQYLVDVVARLAEVPSSDTLRALFELCDSNLKTKVNKVLLVGDTNNSSLPAVSQEFSTIRLAIDTDTSGAIKEGLKPKVQQSAAVHFAVHGFFDRNNPAASGLRLADGVLSSSEIQMLEAYGTRLVTLSACETGHAGTSAELDDVWSIASAFTYAGIPGVIGAFWMQDGAASADFFGAFYRAVANGSDIGPAFRSSMIQTREAHDAEEIPGLLNRRNPCFWAGFNFLGE
jgi:tetratricopeptide (TPR) repeat protein